MIFQRTCLEERMFGILTEMGIEFHEQLSTRSGFIIDFAIYVDRDRKIGIETDGSMWHDSPKQRKRDNFRDMLLKKGGWTMLRFGETFSAEEVKTRVNETIQKLSPG
jgi:very-short-patch-repair endonuclease